MASEQASPARFFGAMNVAAYVTWVVLLVLLLDSAPQYLLRTRVEALLSLVAFLLVFVIKRGCELRRPQGGTVMPLLVLEGLLALLTCVFWSPASTSPILTIVFLADCGLVLGLRGLIVAAVAINAGLYGIAIFVWDYPTVWRILIAYGAFQLFALLTSWYARRAHDIAAKLRETNAHLLATRTLLEESARDSERLRLARELHDVAGHKLTALKLNLTALQREAAASGATSGAAAGAGPSVDAAAQLATELLADIRGVVAQIRQHDGLDIRAALEQLVAPLPAAPRVHLTVHEDARLDSVAQAETLLRVVQEALTNVMRHAGARNVWIELVRAGGEIVLRVRDDGHGQLPLNEGFGLAGMRERLAQISGRLGISRAEQGGVALDVQFPLRP